MNPMNDITSSNYTTSFITINNREIQVKSTVVPMELPTTVLFPRVSTLGKFERIENQSNSCMECRHKFTYSGRMELSNRQEVGLCVGCSRLHEQARNSRELMSMRRWLLNGEVPATEFVEKTSFEAENSSSNSMERLHFRMDTIVKRLRKLRDRSTDKEKYLMMNLPSMDELCRLYLESEKKCKITGWDVKWHHPFSTPMHWAISFDHVVPISKAHQFNMSNPWSINNMQIVSHLINQIKGNAVDEEAKRWLDEWRCGQKHSYSNCYHVYNYNV